MQEPIFSLLDVERRYERRGSGRFRRTARPLKTFEGVRFELRRNANASRARAAFVYRNVRGSRNPRLRIADILAEPVPRYRLCGKSGGPVRFAALPDGARLPACLFPTAIQ